MIGQIFFNLILHNLKFHEYNFWKNIYNNIYLHEIINTNFLSNTELSKIIEKNIELIYNNSKIINIEYINYIEKKIIKDIDNQYINSNLDNDYNKISNIKIDLNKYLVLIRITTKNKILENINVVINTTKFINTPINKIDKIKETTNTITKINYFLYNYDLKKDINIIKYNSKISYCFTEKQYNELVFLIYNKLKLYIKKIINFYNKKFSSICNKKKNHKKKYYNLYYNFLQLRNDILIKKNDDIIIAKTNEIIKDLLINNLFQWIVIQSLILTISITLLSSNVLLSNNNNNIINFLLLLSCSLSICSIYILNSLYFFWNSIHSLQVISLIFLNSRNNCSIIATKIDFYYSCIFIIIPIFISIFESYSNKNIYIFFLVLIIYLTFMFVYLSYLETQYCINSYQFSIIYIENNKIIENIL
jgi:hypothetical protein